MDKIKSFYQRNFVEFFNSVIILPKKVRVVMFCYLFVLINVAFLERLSHLGDPVNFAALGIFITGLMLMPATLVLGFGIVRFVSRRLKGKPNNDKRTFKEKAEGYLQVVFFGLLYFWVMILLIMSLRVFVIV